MSAVADALDLSRPHLSEMRHRPEPRRRGRPPLPDAELATDIRLAIADLSYVATPGGISAEDARDLMVATVEHGFG